MKLEAPPAAWVEDSELLAQPVLAIMMGNSKSESLGSLISSVLGSSTLRCSSWRSASSRAASSCSSRCLRDRMRGDRTS